MRTFTRLCICVVILFCYGINAKHLATRQLTLKLPMMKQVNQDTDDSHSESLSEMAPYFTNVRKMSKVVTKPADSFVMLKCKAGGNPTPNITWYKDNEKPTRRLGYIRYGQWSLNLEDLTSDDSGIYKCVVCNALGCIDFNYTLDVVERYHHRPSLAEPPHNKTAVVGGNVSFKCTFLSDLNLQIYWVKGMPNEHSATATIKNMGSGNPETLELHSVNHESQGWYTCLGANSLGVTAASSYLEVVDP